MEQFARQTVQRLRDAGFQALYAGGCVRDQLLGTQPHDYDVATDATPKQVQQLFRRSIGVGAQFGVIEVLGPEPGLHVQVATFRSDGQYSDGRHPDSVKYGSAEEDAQRRDFTINGLFFDPIDNKVIDYVGGQADLQKQVVRAIGDPRQRIAEDKLRMLRAVRFVSRLGFTLEEGTAEAIRELHAELRQVSAERITDELKKMLTHPQRVQAMSLLRDLRLLAVLFQESERFRFMLVAALPGMVSFPLAWAAFLVDCQRDSSTGCTFTKHDLQLNFGREFRLSQEEIQHVQYLVLNLDDMHSAHTLEWAKVKPLLAHRHRDDLVTLLEADCQAYGKPATGLDYARERLTVWSQEDLEPRVLVTGDDVANLGIPHGPRFKVLLDAIRREQLNEELHSREQALLRLQELAATIG
jgi:poly(A) polymerase